MTSHPPSPDGRTAFDPPRLLHGDCLALLPSITDGCADLIVCDLPFGCLNKASEGGKWDSQIPLEPLWREFLRVTKPNAAIILFAQGMFTAQLMMSQPNLWRYNLIWDKCQAAGFLNANNQTILSMQRNNTTSIYNPPYSPRVSVKVLTGKLRLPRYEFDTPAQVYQYNPMPTSTQLVSRPRLQIIRGLPGSGKSTLALDRYPNLLRLETDMFFTRAGRYTFTLPLNTRAVKWFNRTVEATLRTGMDFVVTGVFAAHTERLGKTIEAALDRGYEVWVKTLTSRYGDVHGVPKTHYAAMKRDFLSDRSLRQLHRGIPNLHFGLMPPTSPVSKPA